MAQVGWLPGGQIRAEQIHNGRREHVHPEKTKVMSRAQTWNNEALLRHRWRGLLQNFGDEVQSLAIFREPAPDRAIIGQLVFMRGLYGGNGARLAGGDFDEL